MSGILPVRQLRCSNCSSKAYQLLYMQRTFTSSAKLQKEGPLLSFTETRSDRLNSILKKFRTKYLLPNRLPPQQQELVYGTNHKEQLEKEPVTVYIGGEKFVLEHIDRTKDLPDIKKSFYWATSLMGKPAWDNFPNLLAGLKELKKSPGPDEMERTVRLASKSGRLDIIIQCARDAASTNLTLKSFPLVRQILFFALIRASKSEWDEWTTKKSLSQAETVAELLEEKDHRKNKYLDNKDPRTSSETIGILLQLSAVRSARHLDGKDENGKVETYAKRLAGSSLEVPEKELTPNEKAAVFRRTYWLLRAMPILHGIREAQKVLGSDSEVIKELQSKSAGLDKKVKEYIDSIRGKEKSAMALEMYDKWLGPEAI